MGINGYFLTLSSNAATIFSTGPMTQVSSAGLSSSSRGLVLLAVDGRFQRQHDDKDCADDNRRPHCHARATLNRSSAPIK